MGNSIIKKKISGIDINIQRKNIKNLYIKIGRDASVTVSAPKWIPQSVIDKFVDNKRERILTKQHVIKNEILKRRINAANGIIYLFGKVYTLKTEKSFKKSVTVSNEEIVLSLYDTEDEKAREKMLLEFYRKSLKEKVSVLMPVLEEKTQLYCKSWQIRNMKTRWGSCNIHSKNILINLQLAKYPEECLEYLIIHELTHLEISSHGREFKKKLDEFMPDWRRIRKELNEDYGYMQ